jgi:hypothetical protein
MEDVEGIKKQRASNKTPKREKAVAPDVNTNSDKHDWLRRSDPIMPITERQDE